MRNIPLAELHPFKGHPFKVRNNEEMQRMIESIRKVGAITPALARPLPDGGYELISGHRRLAACQVLGVETMPVIVRELSDDEAVIAMVDANLQRETILPSEKAFAYKMKLDAIKHQGVTSAQVGQKLLSVEKVFVFVDELGERMRANYLTSAFPKFLESHGLRRMRFHDLRHSCASLLLANGVPLKHIQEWLGHSDFTTTANIYAHLDYKSKITSA